jgi:murein DD-endopeptidase MepM/ murein hydrolase activator NlpD
VSVSHRRTIVRVLLCVFVFVGAVAVLSLKTGPMPAKLDRPKTDSLPAPRPKAKALEQQKGLPLPEAPLADTLQAPERTTTVTDADLNYITARNLLIPVSGVKASQLRDTFTQARSEGRQHDAIDIMAPQGTPVLAATDGLVLKLFQSDRGGVTLYELDPSGRYVYYYAHLMRYADDITEGKQLQRGDLIAYVGDTGNAGAGNFHLHFAISKITSLHKWSGGDPINPYPFLVRQ